MEPFGLSETAMVGKLEASFESWSWVLESTKNLHLNAIIFASDDNDILAAISKPSAWLSLKFDSS